MSVFLLRSRGNVTPSHYSPYHHRTTVHSIRVVHTLPQSRYDYNAEDELVLQSGEYPSWSCIKVKLNHLKQCGSQCRRVLLWDLTLFQRYRVTE